jgi:hypothetical protein
MTLAPVDAIASGAFAVLSFLLRLDDAHIARTTLFRSRRRLPLSLLPGRLRAASQMSDSWAFRHFISRRIARFADELMTQAIFFDLFLQHSVR